MVETVGFPVEIPVKMKFPVLFEGRCMWKVIRV